MITAANITDDMCRSVVDLMPFDRERSLLDGALALVEPHRNHSRHELAKLWTALACTACTLKYLDAPNHPTGCVFVGWGHGWQPCSACGGSGLSPMGNDLRKATAAKAATDYPVKRVTLHQFLTEAQVEESVRLFMSESQGYDAVDPILSRVIEPNLAAINAKLGQESDPRYLAYSVVYALATALEKTLS